MIIAVTLKLADRNDAEFLVDMDNYCGTISSSSYFQKAGTLEKIAKVKKAVTDLRDAINGPPAPDKDKKILSLRNAADRRAVALKNDIEEAANDPDVADINRETIVKTSGMNYIIKESHHGPHAFTVEKGPVSGSVILKARGQVKGHVWKGTTDTVKFTNCYEIEPTPVAMVLVRNLETKVDHAFFHRPIITGEESVWEGPIFFTVT